MRHRLSGMIIRVEWIGHLEGTDFAKAFTQTVTHRARRSSMSIVGWMMAGFCAVLVSLFCPQRVAASGFAIYDFGAAEQAKGNAVVAQVDAPSAVFYNPAGLAGIAGTDLQAGTTVVFPKTTFHSDVTGRDTDAGAGPSFPS